MAITELLYDASTKPTAMLLGALLLLFLFFRVGRRPHDLPPGPPTLPIIGNLHQFPKDGIDIHLKYQEWAKNYGPIFSLMAGQQVTVVITKGHIIKELVDKKGVIYADRPDLWARKLFDNSRVVFRSYDAIWRLERKLYHSVLNITAAKKYYPYQELEALKLCMDLLERPRDWRSGVARANASVATSIAYGIRLPDMDSPETKRLTSNGHGFFNAVASSTLMDWFPAIRPLIDWIPWSINPLARDARKAYLSEKACFYEYYERGLKSNIPCFSRDIAASQKKWAGTPDGELLTDHLAAYTAGVAYEGGADTTRATTHGFIKAMMLYPRVQQKAIEELHAVVGADKLPAGEHIPQLKYLSAIIKEALRWAPTSINGFQHATSKEDRYGSFRIPKGARIVTAVWAANNDEQDFADPREFRPERHKDSSVYQSATATNTEDCGLYSFGAGRRTCPGIHLATNATTIFFARILWAFEILPEIDTNGNALPVDRDAMVGTVHGFPAPFECRFVPRSPEKAALLRSEWDRLSDELLGEDQNYKKVVVTGRS